MPTGPRLTASELQYLEEPLPSLAASTGPARKLQGTLELEEE